jgi:hypothetical protein
MLTERHGFETRRVQLAPSRWKLAVFLSALFAAPQAQAYCRAHTCNRSDPAQRCQIDGDQCVVSGNALKWPANCLKVGISEAGSTRHGIDFEQLRAVTEAAFSTWTNVDCPGGGKPSVRVEVVGPIACDQSEYNSGAGNINLVMFRDDAWPYVGGVDALGTTFVRFNADTGEIWDADIEINGTGPSIGIDGSGEIDLQSLLTHEAGHMLGLDHSDVAGATMVAGYEATDTSLRSLESDDVTGICAIFPPGAPSAPSCEPRGGFSAECGGFIEEEPLPPGDDAGCSMSEPSQPRLSLSLAALAGIALHELRRRRKVPRTEASR